LAWTATQIQEAAGAVEAESADQIVEEHVRIAGPIADVVPSRPFEQAFRPVDRIDHPTSLLITAAPSDTEAATLLRVTGDLTSEGSRKARQFETSFTLNRSSMIAEQTFQGI
jgi:hypothetical protein